jgi:hypothetical protein
MGFLFYGIGVLPGQCQCGDPMLKKSLDLSKKKLSYHSILIINHNHFLKNGSEEIK